MQKVIAKTNNDPSFGLRYRRGEVDIDGRPKPRDPVAVEAKKALIKATKTEASIAFLTDKTTTSRMGGLPDLPPEINWPVKDNIPMVFLGQIALGELPVVKDIDWLPREGILSFFVDSDLYSDWDKIVAKVVFSKEALLSRRPAPADVPFVFSEQAVEFRAAQTYSRTISPNNVVHPKDVDEIWEWWGSLENSEHRPFRWQIGGCPDPLQSDDFAFWCERKFQKLPWNDSKTPQTVDFKQRAKRWRLLGQFEAGWFLGGELGYERGFFWVPSEEARIGNFENVVLLGQST